MITNQIHLAYVIAKVAFAGKMRKWGGRPAISHMRDIVALAKKFPVAGAAEDVVESVIWLHDVVEDTSVTGDDLIHLGVDQAVVDLVLELTNVKTPGLDREAQKAADHTRISRISETAKQIKLLDRLANLTELSEAPVSFVNKYVVETEHLLTVLPETEVSERIRRELIRLRETCLA